MRLKLVGKRLLGALPNLALAGLVIGIIVVLNRFNNPFLRLGSIVIGLTLGFVGQASA